MSPDAVAHAIVYALEQPTNVNVGEIVVRSAAQP
jgi:NADP-dependent 3-hydroxy acid dehydrogenase YdfG